MDETKTCTEIYYDTVELFKGESVVVPDTVNTSLLMNIAHSLAMIADKMCEKEEE